MIISLIVATDEAGGIGKNNQLPWHLHSDLKRFKGITMGHHLVMGRKTYETIGKTLPGRVMIIITHNKKYHAHGCIIVHSLEDAIKYAEDLRETELFVIGGGEIFEQSITYADKIYLTLVHTRVDADVFFPKVETSIWELLINESVKKSEKDEYKSDFKIYRRKDIK